MNTTTLNMTTLDGGVIIKNGTAPAPPSGGGGDSTVEYVSVEGKNLFEWGEALAITAFLVKMPTKIVPVALLTSMDETVNDAIAFALDPTMEFDFQGTRMTIADFLVSLGVDLSTYTHLTKEQFYTLG